MKSDKYYIFLDIDGVLATSNQYFTNPKKWHEEYACYRFDKKCVDVFNYIIDNMILTFEPVIILSSDWQDKYSLEVINRIFEWNEVNTKVTDFTGMAWGIKFFDSNTELEECRAYDITKYVEDHKIENWIAIDDLDLSPWIDEDHFVRTPRTNEGIKQSGKKDKILSIMLN